MERNLFAYIWSHTRRDQLWVMVVTVLAMIPYYMSFDLPKQIINGPITGIGFEAADSTLPFLRLEFDLPLIGHVLLFPGFQMQRMPLLFALSLTFLALVVVNGVVKVYVNTYKGRLGERLLRRIRFELIDRVLRFPPRHFKSVKAGEVASMVKDEVEPLGGFSGEAFAAPVMLVGQALTAMIFIFVQHVGLGIVALLMAGIQVLIIPKLRARLIVLGRQRQLTARQLAGRVAEIVEGIDTIHGSDATNYIRADMVDRLGRIFKIRYDIYQWKFFVKFLNNFIAQLTPFLFYSIGGYLAITGRLDVGQLVAVINAYKELPGPLKGLIDWDMARQDIQVKYEGIVNQFDVAAMIDPKMHAVDATRPSLNGQGLQIRGLSLTDDSGSNALERASARFARGEAVAFVGAGGSGAEALADAVGRVIWPSEGAVQIGDDDILQLPEAVSGRRITFASPHEFFFSGSLEDNLLFRLQNAPREPAVYEGEEADFRRWWRQEADLTGNPVLDLNDRWVDEATLLAHTGSPSVAAALDRVLEIVEMKQDIAQLAMKCPLDPAADAGLAADLLEVRRDFAEELRRRGWEDVVLPFDRASYNDEATIVENLYFGTLVNAEALMALGTSACLARIASETGLDGALFRSGHRIARMAVNLLHDLPPDHPFFARMRLMRADELAEFGAILDRTDPEDFEAARPEDRQRLIWLNAHYSEPWYRFGILTPELKARVLAARARLQDEIPEDLARLIEFYGPDRYLFHADIRDNVIFGKVNTQRLDAEDRIAELGAALRESRPAVVERIMALGLGFDVGAGGRRLSGLQKNKLNLARALLRDSDIYVFNQVLLGLGPEQQRRIIEAALAFLRGRADPPLVIWVLAEPAHAALFDRVLTFGSGRIVTDESRPALSSEEVVDVV